jgi:hypothetical protein
MEVDFIFLGIVFALSSSGISLFSFFSRKQFVKVKLNFAVQAVFWFTLGLVSVFPLINNADLTSSIINIILIISGFLFTCYYAYQFIKDNGAYSLPYAKNANEEAFKTYGKTIGSGVIKIASTRPTKVDIVAFVTENIQEKERIIEEISNNVDIVMVFSSKEAKMKLLNSLLWVVIILGIASIL